MTDKCWTMEEIWAMADRWYEECVQGPVPDSADDLLKWFEKEARIEGLAVRRGKLTTFSWEGD